MGGEAQPVPHDRDQTASTRRTLIFPRYFSRIRQAVGRECLPINLPAKGGTDVVDCFFNPDGEADFSSVKERTRARRPGGGGGQKLMEKYLEQGQVEPGQAARAFRESAARGASDPGVFHFGERTVQASRRCSTFRQSRANATEGNAPPFLKGEGVEAQEFYAVPGPKAHVLAHVSRW